MGTMSVAEVARKSGVSPDTIRYYGRLGLLPEAGRTAGGHRYFDDRTLERLQFIKGAQWFGLKLDEIGELLQISDEGLCPCSATKSLLERKIEAIEAQRSRLDHVHGVLNGLLAEVGHDGFNERAMAEAVSHRCRDCGCQSGGAIGRAIHDAAAVGNGNGNGNGNANGNANGHRHGSGAVASACTGLTGSEDVTGLLARRRVIEQRLASLA